MKKTVERRDHRREGVRDNFWTKDERTLLSSLLFMVSEGVTDYVTVDMGISTRKDDNDTYLMVTGFQLRGEPMI